MIWHQLLPLGHLLICCLGHHDLFSFREKVVFVSFENFAFSQIRLLEHVSVTSGHGRGKENLWRRIKVSTGGEIHIEEKLKIRWRGEEDGVCKKRGRNGGSIERMI
jgi:hypothetical protein